MKRTTIPKSGKLPRKKLGSGLNILKRFYKREKPKPYIYTDSHCGAWRQLYHKYVADKRCWNCKIPWKIKCEISGFLFMNVTDFRLKFLLKFNSNFYSIKAWGMWLRIRRDISSSRQDKLRGLNPSIIPLSWRSEGFGRWLIKITHLIEFTLVFQVSRDVRGDFFPY